MKNEAIVRLALFVNSVSLIVLSGVILFGCTTTTTTWEEGDTKYRRHTVVPPGGKIDTSGAEAYVEIGADESSLLQISSQAIGQKGGDAQAITQSLIQAFMAGAGIMTADWRPPGFGATIAPPAPIATYSADVLAENFKGIRAAFQDLAKQNAQIRATLRAIAIATGVYDELVAPVGSSTPVPPPGN